MTAESPSSNCMLASHVTKRENNLNAIRLVLALAVLFSHCYPLAVGSTNIVGYVAVDLFFFISGFLITASWLRSKSMNEYLRKRVLRIYPGFIAAVLFSTMIMTTANPHGLVSKVVSSEGLKSLVNDGLWLSQGSISGPQVFPHNPFPNYADGSIWTIQIEFKCYLLICVIGLFCLFRFRLMILAAFLCTYILFLKAIASKWEMAALDRRFLTFFLAGTCAWLWRDKIPLRWSVALGSLASAVFLGFTGRFWLIVEPFAFTYIALWLGYTKSLEVTRWCDSTDLSYGVYLYAFPVQQLIALTAWGRNVWVMFLAATPITLILAFLSWHFVEKRFLSLKTSWFSDRDSALSPRETQTDRGFLNGLLS